MTRKPLTANQIIHGARAYSHNASRRAHQLSGPRRERVVCRPVSTPWLSAAINEGIRIGRTDDKPCKCGTLVCGYRGPCARVVEAPKPSPAPVVERQAHRFVVGQRVQCVTNGHGLAIGETYTISLLGGALQAGEAHSNVQVEGVFGWFLPSRFEPSEPLTSERVAQESDEALLVRCGWAVRGTSFSFGGDDYRGAAIHKSSERPGEWQCFKAGSVIMDAYAPTLLQACAAALGITLERSPGAPSLWDARLGDALIVHSADDPESCARAAVEAWSAMQREGASDGK